MMSRKETTQGCLTFMVTCRIGLTPLLNNLQSISSVTKHAVFSDNLAGAEKLLQIKLWWDDLDVTGRKYGHYPKPTKSCIIVKHQLEQTAKRLFSRININITVSRPKHLGAVIRSKSFSENYVRWKVNSWRQQPKILSENAEFRPQAAYPAYINGFKHKFTFLRTISKLQH